MPPAVQSLSFGGQKKETKEKAAPLAVSLRFAAGNLRYSIEGPAIRGQCRRTRSVHFVRVAQTTPAS